MLLATAEKIERKKKMKIKLKPSGKWRQKGNANDSFDRMFCSFCQTIFIITVKCSTDNGYFDWMKMSERNKNEMKTQSNCCLQIKTIHKCLWWWRRLLLLCVKPNVQRTHTLSGCSHDSQIILFVNFIYLRVTRNKSEKKINRKWNAIFYGFSKDKNDNNICEKDTSINDLCERSIYEKHDFIFDQKLCQNFQVIFRWCHEIAIDGNPIENAWLVKNISKNKSGKLNDYLKFIIQISLLFDVIEVEQPSNQSTDQITSETQSTTEKCHWKVSPVSEKKKNVCLLSGHCHITCGRNHIQKITFFP